MFAFVLWDRQKRAMLAARDRLGIKPLCWALRDGALIAASTLEPFFALNEFRSLDPIAVRDLMTFDYILAPRTVFKGVHKLEPGSTLEWSFGQSEPRIERFWAPPAVNKQSHAPDESELEALLDRAVERQMIADVPIGAFLPEGSTRRCSSPSCRGTVRARCGHSRCLLPGVRWTNPALPKSWPSVSERITR